MRGHGPGAASVEVASVQRNPCSEEPEAPSTEYRVEYRNRVEAAVIERPEIGLRQTYVARRPIPSRVPTTRRRRTVPATRRRWAVPVGRRPSGRRPVIPAEAALRPHRLQDVRAGCDVHHSGPPNSVAMTRSRYTSLGISSFGKVRSSRSTTDLIRSDTGFASQSSSRHGADLSPTECARGDIGSDVIGVR